MRNIIFVLFLFLSKTALFSQEENIIPKVNPKDLIKDSIFNPFRLVLEKGLVTEEELNKLAPNRPKYFFSGTFRESNIQYYKKLQLWAEYHPEETNRMELIKDFVKESINRDFNKFFSVVETDVTEKRNIKESTGKNIVLPNNDSTLVLNFPDEYIKNIKNVAPHIPNRPNRLDRFNNDEESMNHRVAMDKWVKDYPEEFKQSLTLDSYLHIFTPDTGKIEFKKDPWPYPDFMRYPVTTLKPELYNTGNPEKDKFVFDQMTQHWYFKYDKPGYEKLYGHLPVINIDNEKFPVK